MKISQNLQLVFWSFCFLADTNDLPWNTPYIHTPCFSPLPGPKKTNNPSFFSLNATSYSVPATSFKQVITVYACPSTMPSVVLESDPADESETVGWLMIPVFGDGPFWGCGEGIELLGFWGIVIDTYLYDSI